MLMVSGALGSLMLFSCRKEIAQNQDCTAPEVTYDNYLPLKIGNYWVYEYKTIDTLGNLLTRGGYYDTITVVGKELINGRNYFKTEHSRQVGLKPSFPSTVRSFKGKIVSPKKDSTGAYLDEEYIVFSLEVDSLKKLSCVNLGSFTNCELRVSSYNLSNASSITVPAGNFNTRIIQDQYLFQLGWPYWGNERKVDHNYSKDIGLVKTEMFYLSSTQTIVWELMDYHLE